MTGAWHDHRCQFCLAILRCREPGCSGFEFRMCEPACALHREQARDEIGGVDVYAR